MEARNRRTRSVHDMEIDEISLVDRPANQHALVTIAKRANEEDAVPEEYFDPQSGEEVDVTQLQDGDVVVDGEGNAFEFTADDDGDDQASDEAEDGEYAEVGKSLRSTGRAFRVGTGVGRSYVRNNAGKKNLKEYGEGYKALRGSVRGRAGRAGVSVGANRNLAIGAGGAAAIGGGGYEANRRLKKSFADEVREELSKAVTDADRDEVLAKALGQLDEYEAGIAEAQEIAKSERDLRLTREYIAKAAEYNVPVDPEDLGPVLLHMAEALPYEDCLVIHKALSAAGEMLFDEAGYTGQADNLDPFEQVEALLDERVSKGNEPVSKAKAVTEFFDNDPRAYDEYRASLGR
jgi:hypothetical protein